jgi:hypothetical protein
MLRSTVLALMSAVVISSGCAGHRVVVEIPSRETRAMRPAPPPEPVTLTVKEIHAEVVSARVIYAKEVHAREGRVGRIEIVNGAHGGHKGGELKMNDVVADVIHCKEIHADYVEADVIYAKEVKIGR